MNFVRVRLVSDGLRFSRHYFLKLKLNKMVRTGYEIPITERLKNLFFWFWGLIYLFFATIFNDPKALDRDQQRGTDRWGARGTGGNIHGLKRGGPSMGGG